MKEFWNKYYRRIIPCLVLITVLGAYSYILPTSPNNPTPGPAPSPFILDDDVVPLSNTFESTAKFYLFNPGEYTPTFTNVTPDLCEFIGEGKVTFNGDIYNDSELTASAITSVPDYTNLVTDNMSIEWSTIYKLQDTICVIGLYSDKPNVIASTTQTTISDEAVAILEEEGVVDISNAINVCDYGMVGDGVFDNTAIFKQLIKEHPTLYIPAGQYMFNSAVAVTRSVSLVGESQDSTVFLFDNETNQKNWNFQVACSDFTAANLSFVLNKTEPYPDRQNISSTLIKVSSGDNNRFEKCSFACDGSTPYLYNTFWIISDGGPVSNVTIHDCKFTNDGHNKVGGNLWIYGCSFPISNVSITHCDFFHNGWDENVGIWSKASVTTSGLEISDCNITNSNSIMSSDQLMSVLMRTDDSSIRICNNNFNGEGRINTGIKLKGSGSYVFDSNNVTISNQIDDQTNYGFALVLDSDMLQFTNNNLSFEQNFTARLRMDSIEKFESNRLAISAPGLKIDCESAQNREKLFTLDNNNFEFSVPILDISSSLLFNGGSIDFLKNTAIYLPYSYSSTVIENNCAISGKAKVNFNNSLTNTFEISNCDYTDQITANVASRLLVN